MKKMLFSALCIATVTTILLLACKKTATTEATTTCSDSAYLLPDSFLACSPAISSGYKMFSLGQHKKIF